jgi:hypothetical protein
VRTFFACPYDLDGTCTEFNFSVPIGGGNCTENQECNNLVGGLCVLEKCQCFDGWACPYCTNSLAGLPSGINLVCSSHHFRL